MAESSLSDVFSALTQRGFHQVGVDSNGGINFVGPIPSNDGSIEVELTIVSPSDLPRIRLLDVPQKLKPVAPHVGYDGGLCYAAHGSIALDIFDWVGQTLSCLDRATEVLNLILSNQLVQDLADEFFACWYGESCFIDLQSSQSQNVYAALFEGAGVSGIVISESLESSAIKLAALGCELSDSSSVACVITTVSEPLPLLTGGRWPPKKLHELLAWQRELDGNCAKKLLKRLRQAAIDGHKHVTVLFKSPTSQYVAGIIFPKDKLHPNNKKQNILSKIYESQVIPLSSIRIDDLYIAQRNQPNRKTLIGKKIILIGCGTIGGYLAELLLKAGAGFQGGQLVLIDTDSFSAGNIGRHRLGFNSILKNKAQELALELIRSMPTANVKGDCLDARELNFDQFDLIINSTGEQPLSDELSSKLNKNPDRFRPILHCWIEGPGVAARTFLQDDVVNACYRCLTSDLY